MTDASGMRRRVERSRRARVVALGLGLAVGPTLLGCGVNRDVDRPVRAPTWNQTHRVDLSPGWTVTQRNVSPTDESTSLSGPEGGCLVRTSPSKPERFLRPRFSRKASVGGRRAVYGPLDPGLRPVSAGRDVAAGEWRLGSRQL